MGICDCLRAFLSHWRTNTKDVLFRDLTLVPYRKGDRILKVKRELSIGVYMRDGI